MSPVTTVTFGRRGGLELGGEIAIDLDRQQRVRPAPPAAAVIAPRPGPISRTARRASRRRPPRAWRPTPASRKCCANRLRGSHRRRPRRRSSSARRASSALRSSIDLLFAHPEVVAELVDQRFADRDDDLVFVAVAVLLDRALEQRDAVGQLVAVIPAPLGERRALVEAEQRVRRLDLHLVEQLVRRLVLDDDARRCAPRARTARGMVSIASSTSSRNSLACHRLAWLLRWRLERQASSRAASRLSSGALPRLTGFGRRSPVADRNRNRAGRCSAGTAASAGRCGGRAESARRTRASSAPAAACSHSCASTFTGSSLLTRPRRLATRSTWRSTGSPGTPSA